MENELIVSKNMQNIIIAGNGPSLKNINYKDCLENMMFLGVTSFILKISII